jgi:hypothetical protein
MAIDRAGARRRVRTITGWAAAGAVALTAAAAFGAARGNHAAKATTRGGSGSPGAAEEDSLPQQTVPQPTYPQDQQGAQGFTPPSSSTAPPAGMSGGS